MCDAGGAVSTRHRRRPMHGQRPWRAVDVAASKQLQGAAHASAAGPPQVRARHGWRRNHAVLTALPPSSCRLLPPSPSACTGATHAGGGRVRQGDARTPCRARPCAAPLPGAAGQAAACAGRAPVLQHRVLLGARGVVRGDVCYAPLTPKQVGRHAARQQGATGASKRNTGQEVYCTFRAFRTFAE